MLLTREIIRRILFNVGAIPDRFGNYGLTTQNFLLDEKLFINYDDDEKVGFSTWAGEIVLSNTKVRALLIDLSQDDIAEYALAFRVDNKPIYLLRLAYDEEDFGDFLVQDGDNWVTPKILVQSWALIGMETIIDQGMIWYPSSSYEDLLQVIPRLLEA